MAAQEEDSHHLGIAQRFQHVADGEEIAEGLRHLVVVDSHEAVVHPHMDEGRAAGRAGLRDFVLVMRELEVHAAAVKVEVRSQQARGHRRALDVPPRPALAPGRRPVGLAGLGPLPQHEIQRIELGLVDLHPRAGPQIVDSLARQPPVVRKLPHRVHHVAVRGDVGETFVDQRLRHRDDGAYEIGGARLQIRFLQAQRDAILVHRRGVPCGELAPILAVLRGPLDDLVVDIGDVADERDLVALRPQIPLHQVEHRQHARMADVEVVVHGDAAHVHAHFVVVQGFELFFFAREGVMDF